MCFILAGRRQTMFLIKEVLLKQTFLGKRAQGNI